MDVEKLLELQEAKKIIDTTDFRSIIERLVKVESWSKAEAEEAVAQYRNYLFLRKKYPEYHLPPSTDIDEVWHTHILHTKEYREFCEKIFGKYLDHHPHAVTENSISELEKLFVQTMQLYFQEFGQHIYQITGRSFMRKVLDKVRDRLFAKFPKLIELVES